VWLAYMPQTGTMNIEPHFDKQQLISERHYEKVSVTFTSIQ